MTLANDAPILVVDDEANMLSLYNIILTQAGLKILQAQSGEEALKILKSQAISVIVSDQFMPGMKGAELLRLAAEIQPDTERVLATSSNDIGIASNAVNQGKISFFLQKPIRKDEFLNKVNKSLDIYRTKKNTIALQAISAKQRVELESMNLRLIQSVHLQAKLFRSGWKIQQSLLMDQVPQNLKGVSICGSSIPAQDLDGDFIFYHRFNSTLFDFVVGDVMGKGLNAALTGAAIRGEFMKEWGRTEALGVEAYGPGDIIEAVSERMGPRLMKISSFISLFYGRMDLDKKILTFVDCGSVKPLRVTSEKDQQEYHWIEGNDCPIGVLHYKNEVHEEQLQLKDGDLLFFYSDGIIEAHPSNPNTMYGMERLAELLGDSPVESPVKTNVKVLDAIRAFSGAHALLDDFTCVSMLMGDSPQDPDELELPDSDAEAMELSGEMIQTDEIRVILEDRLQKLPNVEGMDLIKEMIVLAIHEAYTNIIRHAYEGMEGFPVWLRCHLLGGDVKVELMDFGRPFDPDQVPEVDLSGDRDGGYGMHMMREIANEVSYGRDDQARNCLSMSFNIQQLKENPAWQSP